MENLGNVGFMMKKRRSVTTRRPRPEGHLVVDSHGFSPLSSTPSSNDSDKLSLDDNGGSESGFRRKEYYLNNPPPRSSETSKKGRRDDYGVYQGGGSSRSGNGSDLRRSSEGVLAPAKWKNANRSKESFERELSSMDVGEGKGGQSYNVHQPEGHMNVRKVKLKVCGVTRTIHAKSDVDVGGSGSETKPRRPSGSSRYGTNYISQDSSGHSQAERGNGFHGNQWKDSGGSGFSYGARDDRRGSVDSRLSEKHSERLQSTQSTEPTRKSKRVPKKRIFDDVDDDEMHYRDRVRTFKLSVHNSGYLEENDEEGVKKKKLSKLPKSKSTLYEMDEDYVIQSRDRRMKQAKESEDMDYSEEDEEEAVSHEMPDAKRKKQAINDPLIDVRTEPHKTRQRALQSGKDSNGENTIEFPEGLPSALSKKSKEKLSEVEIQAKKTEAAQRRKMQAEKQAREIEASAIRKILGHDSDKKKEEKKQKELEEKKAAKSEELGPSTIRLSMGPSGTLVTFSEDLGLPIIFSSKATSYPPPREKCAGPSCLKPYKYRDSKSKLPLCSLQCYRAVQGN